MSLIYKMNELEDKSATDSNVDENAVSECVECGEDKLPEFGCPVVDDTCVACCDCDGHQWFM